jgi:hypothetical protein
VDKPEKVTFRFTKDDSYRFAAVNGVWGGPTPRGDICVDFFYEHLAVPDAITQSVLHGEKLGPELTREPDGRSIERTIVFGMMLTLEQAESIGEWLRDKARVARAVRKALKSEESDVTDSTRQ